MSERQKTKYNPAFLDDEERQDIAALHAGQLVSDPDLEARKRALKAAAKSMSKRKPVTLRLLEDDIRQLKVRASEDGLPYQTLVSSIIHKYVTGRLSERD